MSENINRLYIKALRAVVRERHASGGGKFKTAEERADAKQTAKWASESPVYQAIESKQKLVMPSAAEIKKRSKMYALRYITGEYRRSWQRSKVAPEHRQSIMEQAERLSSDNPKGSFIPRKLGEQIRAAQHQRKNVAVARVSGDWFTVDHIAGRKADMNFEDTKPFFIGPGNGYDIFRIVIFTDEMEDAYQIAEEKYPHFMFTKVITMKQYDKLEELGEDGWEENPEHYHFIETTGKYGLPEEDIRIFKQVTEFSRTAKPLDAGSGHLYRLTDGRVIEAH